MATQIIRKPNLRILNVRAQRVVLDSDLAQIYGVATGRFNEAVKRNLKRFPADFSFVVTREEYERLISQNAISKPGRGGRTDKTLVFHGTALSDIYQKLLPLLSPPPDPPRPQIGFTQ
jgi:hypothetical protein